MSVLHIISGLGVGGAERMLIQVASGLRAGGLPQQVVSLTTENGLAGEFQLAGLDPTICEFRNPLRLPFDFVRLLRLVATLRPSVIQGWMYHGNLIAALLHQVAPGRGQRRLFWNIRASDVDDTYSRIVRWTAQLSHWPDLVIANAEAGVRTHLKFGYRPRRIEVIPNGIDVQKFRPDPERRRAVRAELGLDDSLVVAVHVARVDKMKDHANFLAAMANLPDLVGLLVGQGTEELHVPPNVRALGRRSDVERICAAGDLIVSSSAFAEGFSNAIAEGMSAGLVPVVTDVGDARQIVGDSGTVVPRSDTAALTAALAAAGALSDTERQARGAAARQRIVQNFTIESVIESYRRIYAG